jgi:nucleotide-binding universal stress UspA family protein
MTGRVVVGFAPSPTGYQALRYAVEQAIARQAPLVIARAVRVEPYDWSAEGRVYTIVAVTVGVETAFREAMGRAPVGLDARVVVDAGRADTVLVATARQPDDLLVLGSCMHRRMRALTHGAMLRRCLRKAVCAVVIVPPPTMARDGSATRLGREIVSEMERHLRRPVELTS